MYDDRLNSMATQNFEPEITSSFKYKEIIKECALNIRSNVKYIHNLLILSVFIISLIYINIELISFDV